MEEDGIIIPGTKPRKQSQTRIKARKWLKTREIWLITLGIALHAVYMLSIFDIYFKSPIVHGMEPVSPRFTAPAKRLVLLVADGLRADKFFEPDSDGNYRAPFLRSVIKGQGRWGVSHARPPTESRPGHVAIIAGFYEDPSAVTKGWKANPVEFDSVFNKSRHTFSYGSPDIVPIFCGALPHSTWNTYPHEYEDFATDASFLDEWSFDQFESIVNKSKYDPKLKQLIHQDQIVIFLHLLGCDSNGHAHRPYSSIYLNNVKVVDRIAEGVYNLLENYFKDNQTAYIFTADHGMSDKGSHGDGHWSVTDTPLVAWGAGVKHPRPAFNNHEDRGEQFVDEHHMHDTPTPTDWGLSTIERVDVNQADIAPLMVVLCSTLIGLPCPVNSVGSLPLDYVDLTKGNEVEAVLANTKQILNQFLRKSQLKQATSFRFKPYEPLAHYTSSLEEIESLISVGDYEHAMKLSKKLKSLALDGLHYFQTYDWFMLMSVIILGYTGWMLCLILHVLQSYTSLPGKILKKEEAVFTRDRPSMDAEVALKRGFWHAMVPLAPMIGKESFHVIELSATSVVSIVILECLVRSFTERVIYTWCFLIVGVISPLYLIKSIPWESGIPVFLWLACWFLSVFTLMPAEIPDNTVLVSISGIIIVVIGGVSRYLDMHTRDNKYWRYLIMRDSKPKFPWLFQLQALLVGLSSILVYLSTSHRTEKRELLALHQMMNWSIAGFSMVLPLFSATGLLSRLASIYLGFAPPFLLLSIGYEAVFYGALGLALFGWILFENALLYVKKPDRSLTSFEAENGNIILEEGDRCLQLSDMRIPVVFVKNTGSWMEIGNSISHFGIVSAQVVFVLLLFALTSIYTKDIQTRSAKQYVESYGFRFLVLLSKRTCKREFSRQSLFAVGPSENGESD
ncbi:GPI ethanolamine phosphate transferase 1 [Tanacetum coccineum]